MRRLSAMAVSTVFLLSTALPAFSAESDDAAKALFESKCSVCHGTDRPLSKNKDKEGWEATVKRMQSKKPDNFNDEEAKKIADYLTKVRGPK